MKKYKRKRSSIAVAIIVLCAVIGIILLLVNLFRNGKSAVGQLGDSITNVIEGEEGRVTTVSQASLEKVFEISELSTADYTYNAIARAYSEDGTTVRYYVSYEGTIKAGIDFSKIEVDINEEEKNIIITLPDVEIQDQIVDPSTLEFIFIDKKSETETVHREAYQLCESDLADRTANEEELFLKAEENAAAVVEALVTPWVKQIDEEYTIEIQ